MVYSSRNWKRKGNLNQKDQKDRDRNNQKDSQNDKKGQFFSFDAIVGLLIFVVTISILVTYWYNIQQVMQTQDTSSRVIALRISDMLFTEGSPKNWNNYDNPKDIYMIGLMSNGSLDLNKISKLHSWLTDSMTHEPTKLLMKTGGYDLQVLITGEMNNPIIIGKSPECNTTITTFTRVAPLYLLSFNETVAVDVTTRVWICPS